jgi:glucose-6-phosphate isomerase
MSEIDSKNIEAFDRFCAHFWSEPDLKIDLDLSRIAFEPDFFPRMEPEAQRAILEMVALERGAIANQDEKRMVGHYWLRAPELAPRPELRAAIEETVASVITFAGDVHAGRVKPEKADRFENVLVIGIGGSALGPELVHAALGTKDDAMRVFFFDNTDPDGFDKTLDAIGEGLGRTLAIVISKSGGTKETRNGMLEARAAYERAGLSFGKHAVAVTGEGSELDRYALAEGFLARFPMWDWVGGRTSELSAVGLLPAALQGIDVRALLDGARAMDVVTRRREARRNPAALLALAWFSATGGVGGRTWCSSRTRTGWSCSRGTCSSS